MRVETQKPAVLRSEPAAISTGGDVGVVGEQHGVVRESRVGRVSNLEGDTRRFRHFLYNNLSEAMEQGRCFRVNGPGTLGYDEASAALNAIEAVLSLAADKKPQRGLVSLDILDIYITKEGEHLVSERAFAHFYRSEPSDCSGVYMPRVKPAIIECWVEALQRTTQNYSWLEEYRTALLSLTGSSQDKLLPLIHGLEVLHQYFEETERRRFVVAHEIAHSLEKEATLSSKDTPAVERLAEHMFDLYEKNRQALAERCGYQNWEDALGGGVVIESSGACITLLFPDRKVIDTGMSNTESSFVSAISRGQVLNELMVNYLEQVCASVYERLSGLNPSVLRENRDSGGISMSADEQFLNNIVRAIVVEQKPHDLLRLLANSCGASVKQGMQWLLRQFYFDDYGFYKIMSRFDRTQGRRGAFLKFLSDCDKYGAMIDGAWENVHKNYIRAMLNTVDQTDHDLFITKLDSLARLADFHDSLMAKYG